MNRRGYVREFGGNRVRLVRDGGGRAVGGDGIVQIPGAFHGSNGR